MNKRLRVLIAEDHLYIRQAVRAFLLVLGFEVVAEADNGRLALGLVEQHQPDLIIMDLSMPELSGPEATRLLRRDYPHIPVVMLSAHDDAAWVTAAFEAGGLAYVLKDSAYDELPAAIGCALEGRHFVSRQIHGGVKVLREFLTATTQRA
jgi:two-component system response regulator DegU